MPYDYDRLVSEVRSIDLAEPDISTPNDDVIFAKGIDIAQVRHSQQQNSSVSWSVDKWDLQTSPGKVEYPIPAAAFGKPVRIHTIDPADRYHCTRKVEVCELQNVEQYYQGTAQAQGYPNNRHSAVVFAIYWKFGAPYLQPFPTPGESSRYRVWFETGEIAEPSFGDTLPVQIAFHRYLRVSTSIAVISQCWWTRLLGENPSAVSPAQGLEIMDAQRATLLGNPLTHGLLKQEQEFKREWDDYISTSQQSGTTSAHGYGDAYLLGEYWP